MSHDIRPRAATGASSRDDAPVDRLELHHRQQLSALVDGELAPEEARFLLRRLQHDQDLAGSYERWQLCGQVMRGQLGRMAEPGFAAAVAAAVSAEPPLAAAAGDGARRGWVRWGGGAAALAASVAVVALFMGQAVDPAVDARQPAPTMAGAPEAPAAPVAAAPVVPAPAAAQAPAVDQTLLAVAEPAAAASAAEPRRAPRPQPVVREPLRSVASVREVVRPAAPAAEATIAAAAAIAGQATPQDPFASIAPLHARPWPRAALPQQAAGAFTANFGNVQAQGASRPFYPFEPTLPARETGAADPAPPSLPSPPPVEDSPR